MRDPNRIPELIERLRNVWEEHPDLRLSQLVENIHTILGDPYYLEDEEYLRVIEKFYGRDNN